MSALCNTHTSDSSRQGVVSSGCRYRHTLSPRSLAASSSLSCTRKRRAGRFAASSRDQDDDGGNGAACVGGLRVAGSLRQPWVASTAWVCAYCSNVVKERLEFTAVNRSCTCQQWCQTSTNPYNNCQWVRWDAGADRHCRSLVPLSLSSASLYMYCACSNSHTPHRKITVTLRVLTEQHKQCSAVLVLTSCGVSLKSRTNPRQKSSCDTCPKASGFMPRNSSTSRTPWRPATDSLSSLSNIWWW